MSDPRRTESARSASEHHFIRPGSDALFLLSLVNEVFSRGPVRLGNLEGLTRGLDELRAVAKGFPAAFTADHTGVSAEVLGGIATRLLTARRAAVYGRMGTTTAEFGTNASWLVDVVNALTGHLDEIGGAMFPKAAAFAHNTAGRPGSGRGIERGVTLPTGYYVVYGGQFESEQAASRTIAVLGGAVVVGILVLLLMAFGSLLGGLMTLIGTSPNVIVSRMRAEMLGEPQRDRSG